MVRKTKKAQEEYTFLGLELTGYKAAVDAAINYEVKNLRNCFSDTRIYRFDSSVEITGTCIYPDERALENYEISVYGREESSGELDLTLKDCHVLDDDYTPKYRKIRGKEVPVYKIPKGLGLLNRIRGTKNWSGYAWVPPRTVSDMQVLLVGTRPLYLALHELKIGRHRWIDSLTVQTTNPAEE
ncbi:hypothetical protein N9235_00560 [Gammaproteobacteria bacterium]|nr:hypothetical protein [Gammaproteobacteria bacterium]